jgi:hypothetical protein
VGPVSAPAAPVVFVPVFVPVEVPTDVIQSVVQEEAAEAVVQEATALTITSAQSVAVAENTVTAFHTVITSPISGGGTSFSLPSGESNNDLFTINASTGELSFVTPPDFEAATEFNVRVVAANGAASASQGLAISVTDLNPQTLSNFVSNANETESDPLSSTRLAALSRYADWNDITQFVPGVNIGETAFGQDGTYTYTAGFVHNAFRDDSNIPHINSNSTEIIYRLRDKTVDVSISGQIDHNNLGAQLGGTPTPAAFNIQVKNEPVAQFVDSFSVGNMRWATDPSAFTNAVPSIALDGDDIFTISSSTSEDVSQMEFQLSVDIFQDTQTDTAVVLTTDFVNGRNGESSSLAQEMGAPTITD